MALHVGLISDDPAMRTMLEQSALTQSRSALLLRANGRREEAARAAHFAARTRLILHEPKVTAHMHAVTRRLYEMRDTGSLLERALEGAISLLGADIGNLQVRNPITGTLGISADSGFSTEFLDYFAAVDDDTSACGRAASQCSQVVIVDVDEDPA